MVLLAGPVLAHKRIAPGNGESGLVATGWWESKVSPAFVAKARKSERMERHRKI